MKRPRLIDNFLGAVLTIVIATALTLSCSSDDGLPQADVAESQPLEFSATAAAWDGVSAPAVTWTDEPETRATITTRAAITRAAITSRAAITTLIDLQQLAGGFGVFAFQTTGPYTGTTPPNYLYNEQVLYDSALPNPHWYYTNTKLWPTDPRNKISVFAYAPYAGAHLTPSAKSDTGDPTITYTHPTPFVANIASQTDLLYASAVDQQRSPEGKVTGPANKVNLTFSHALSEVTVQVINKCTRIADLAFTGLTVEGTLCKSGTFNLHTGTWSSTTTGSMTLTPTADTPFLLIPQTGASLTFTLSFTSTYTTALTATATATVDFVQNKSKNIKLTVDDDTHFEVIIK